MTLDRLNCIHEGSHAIVGTIFGYDISHVVVHAPGARADEGGHCFTASWRSEINTDPHRTLVYLLAGSAGERRLNGISSARDASDRELARDIAMTVAEVDDPQHPRVRALLASAEAQATLLMYNPTAWRAIERTAAALQRKGRTHRAQCGAHCSRGSTAMTNDATSILSAAAVLRELLRPIQEGQDEIRARLAALEERPIGAVDRGVHRAGSTYQRGDGVSFRGGFWIAQERTSKEPGNGASWRLAVMRGKAGREGTCRCAERERLAS